MVPFFDYDAHLNFTGLITPDFTIFFILEKLFFYFFTDLNFLSALIYCHGFIFFHSNSKHVYQKHFIAHNFFLLSRLTFIALIVFLQSSMAEDIALELRKIEH